MANPENPLEPLPGEDPKDTIRRLQTMARSTAADLERERGKVAEQRRGKNAAGIAAALAFLLLLGTLWWCNMHDDDTVSAAKYNALGKEYAAYKLSHPSTCTTATPSSTPVTSSVGVSESALLACLQKLPDGLPYQPTAPQAAAPAKAHPKKGHAPSAPAPEVSKPKVNEGVGAEWCTNQEGVNPKATKNSRGCTCYIDNTKGDIVADFFQEKAVAETMKGSECKSRKDAYLAGINKPKVGQADQELHKTWK